MLSTLVTVTRQLETRIFHLLKVFFTVLSGVAIVGMMGVVAVDATLRKVFGTTFYGAYDSVTYLLSILIFLSIVICQFQKAHFSIDLITSRFTYKVRMWIYSIGLFISVLVCWLTSWQLITNGIQLLKKNATFMEFDFIPTYPFPWIGAICFVILGLLFLLEAIDYLGKASVDEPGETG